MERSDDDHRTRRAVFPADPLEQLINANGLIDGELAVKNKLGTELVSLSAVMDRLKAKYGSDQQHSTFRQVTVASYLGSPRPKSQGPV